MLLGLGQLQSAAASALAVAEWIRDEYRCPPAPLGTVTLLLSPSQSELASTDGMSEASGVCEPSRTAEVSNALDEWFARCASDPGNVGLFYAAGHGIDLTKDDGGIVLLEDFEGRPPFVLKNAIDTGNIRKAMAGPTMAQNQFYFVDACRVRPEYVLNVELKTGIRLDEPAIQGPRASPIFYSASAETLALGKPGKGTLFSQALLDCFREAAATTDENGAWRVSDTSLVGPLARRVQKLAVTYGTRQTTTTGGQFADATIQALAEPPTVSVTIGVDPSTAKHCSLATVSNTRSLPVVTAQALNVSDVVSVPAGVYMLEVEVRPPTPPYSNSKPVPFEAPTPHPVIASVR